MKILPVEQRYSMRTDGQTTDSNRQTDMTTFIVKIL